MLSQIAYYLIFGKPLIMYGGIITFTVFVIVFLIPVLKTQGVNFLSFKWHKKLAWLAILLSLIHGTLGMAIYFGW